VGRNGVHVKVKRRLGYLLGVAFLVSIAFAFENCSGVKFTAVPNSQNGLNNTNGNVTTTGGGLCTLSSVTVPINILFVVDQSGSNAVETQDAGTETCLVANLVGCAPPTDPNKTFRGGSITTFFTDNQNNTSFSWGFLGFSNDRAQSLIGSRASFGNASAMQNAINKFYNETDQGDTPYLAALSSAQTAIADDPCE